MPDDKKSNPIAWLLLCLALIAAVGAGATSFKKWFGFDCNCFGDSKLYFLSKDQKLSAVTTEALKYKKFADFALLKDVADVYSSDTNNAAAQVSQVYLMVDCYKSMYEALPKIYNDIDAYNANIAIGATMALVLVVCLLWGVYYLNTSRLPAGGGGKEGEKVAKSIKSLERKLSKIQKAQEAQTKPNSGVGGATA